MSSNNRNEKILRVLKKMDDVLNRYGINHYQERIHRIHKVLLSIEKHSNCFVSKFSFDKSTSNNNDFNLNQNSLHSSHNIASEKEYQNQTLNKDDRESFENNDSLINPDTSLFSTVITFTKNEKGNEILKLNNGQNSSSMNLELDELFKFIEDELKSQSLLNIQDSTQFSSNSDEEEFEKEKLLKIQQESESNSLNENNIIFNNEEINIYNINKNKNLNEKNLTKNSKIILTEKKFTSSQKTQENENPPKILNRENIKNKFFNIELKLRTYLKEFQNIFESHTFDSFLNEDKLRTPISYQTAKLATPSIIKNFFEDKEVIEITKKRHSVAGDVLKSRIEKLKEMEIKQKCFSNLNNINNLKGENKKNSNVSDFSLDLSDCNSLNINSEFDETVSDFKGKNEIRLCKRGSILRERFSRLNINFDIVQEERFISPNEGSLNEDIDNLEVSLNNSGR